jgi:UDP-glucose 4-epimerase
LDQRPPTVVGAQWKNVDITQPEQLIEATKGIEAIYHLAAVSDVNIAFQNPLACVDINLRGTANVLEAARANKLGRVIFASTIWVYQASTNPELS